MFRIRNLPDDTSPGNAAAVVEVQAILRSQFPGLDEEDISSLPEKLRDPLRLRFRPILLIAEDARSRVRGFAMMLHAPDLGFCYLDFIAVAPGRGGGGVGGALYERLREQCVALEAIGLFFECLPDDPALCGDEQVRAANEERLRFYERYGARPIAGTAYETPIVAGDDNAPYLCLDGLGHGQLPGRDKTRQIVRAVLERKYAGVCPAEYVEKVVLSFNDDPIKLRAPRYQRRRQSAQVVPRRLLEHRVALVVNDKHDIHHVRDRGYVEAPVRIAAILRELEPTGQFTRIEPNRFSDEHILAVHDGRLVDYLRRACALVGDGPSVYPYVFPIRNRARPPREYPLRAGYWCIDTFTPINRNAWLAARRAVDCTLTAAERVLEGQHIGYALIRPPGHHAEHNAFGGFCYFNNAAIAAHFFSRYGRVAVLDIDYHHGNGTQDIFYDRGDVLTVSIHGHPSFAYPYFSGFAQETGRGRGAGFNLNFPLPETQTPEQHRRVVQEALRHITKFDPDFLVVAAGFDTAAGDPTGSWSNRREDFQQLGTLIGALDYPTLVVQEGGYKVRTLGGNVRSFFTGLVSSAFDAERAKRLSRPSPRTTPAKGFEFRSTVHDDDREAVRSLVAVSGVFSSDEAAIALELVDERLQRGVSSGYHFEVAEQGGAIAGFACYGPIAGAEGRYDLYWIVVHPRWQREGLARALLGRVEKAVARAQGARIYVDTADGEPYAAARAFYRKMGFKKLAELKDFYSNGDAKLIYAKSITAAASC